ncbi:MAG: beta-galactosidase, partial [Anaerolineae bacterium]|nr:beta-galactosidase [Anaerolineae bacterium]
SRYIRVISEFWEHTYGGWYIGNYRDYSALPGTPILTEFGAQALPNVASMKEMVGESWPPDWAKMAYHDFQYDQTFHVAKIPLGNNWVEFVENSQNYQSQLLKYAIELYRKNKYKALGGMFQFMFMDCWPSVTWSVIGYDRQPKKGYHTLVQVYQPVLIGVNLGRDVLMKEIDPVGFHLPIVVRPWVVNDRHEALENCTYSVCIKNGEFSALFHQERTFTVPSDGVLDQAPSLVISNDFPAGKYQVELVLRSNAEVLSTNQYDLTIVSTAVDAVR